VTLRRRACVAALASVATVGSTTLAGCSASPVSTFATLADARRAIESLAQPGWRHAGAWNVPQVLNHAAQSVEYSLRGFPQPRSALFQGTLGKAAFAVFDARGRMSHGLDEPIPGAPALAAGDPLAPAIERLLKSLAEFEAHRGPLAPHFAYGALDKAQYERAHLMHLANHWTEFART
jgi:hypothetical protein